MLIRPPWSLGNVKGLKKGIIVDDYDDDSFTYTETICEFIIS